MLDPKDPEFLPLPQSHLVLLGQTKPTHARDPVTYSWVHLPEKFPYRFGRGMCKGFTGTLSVVARS